MSEYNEPTGKTKEKYDLFVDYYLESFNATQSAIKAGYSKNTAGQQGYRLLKNVYIHQKIQEEMGKLRDRMRDEGLRSFSMLLGIALETEDKLQKHEVAEKEIDRINHEISMIDLQLARLSRNLSNTKRLADALDGRKTEYQEKKRGILAHVETIDQEMFELRLHIKELEIEKHPYQKNYLLPKEWERFQLLKKSVYQDILDRGGFKAMDKVELSGSVNQVNPFKDLSDEELRRLANADDG